MIKTFKIKCKWFFLNSSVQKIERIPMVRPIFTEPCFLFITKQITYIYVDTLGKNNNNINKLKGGEKWILKGLFLTLKCVSLGFTVKNITYSLFYNSTRSNTICIITRTPSILMISCNFIQSWIKLHYITYIDEMQCISYYLTLLLLMLHAGMFSCFLYDNKLKNRWHLSTRIWSWLYAYIWV